MAKILTVGVATLDVVLSVTRYPREDEEIRAEAAQVRRGGNAANTAVVLSQLGHDCAWAGVTTSDGDGARIRQELARAGVRTHLGQVLGSGSVPTSYILADRSTGSRTIIHHRDLPEFSFDAFRAIDLTPFQWLHFEGRNVPETARMLRHARSSAPTLPLSLEVEKPREGIEELFPLADVLLFSRLYAEAQGFPDPGALLRQVAVQSPRALLICAWGEGGASARSYAGEAVDSPAFPPAEVVDTVGAGDVLNAGVIHGLVQQQPLATVLRSACRLAGEKCGRPGLEDLPLAMEMRPVQRTAVVV
jgi:ketohexokinase